MSLKKLSALMVVLFISILGVQYSRETPTRNTIPREEQFGIYALDLATGDVSLIYSSPHNTSGLQLSFDGVFAFFQEINGEGTEYQEICTVNMDGTNFARLTSNDVMDTYPSWSPDGEKIAFLSWRDATMDIYVMDKNGSNVRKLYDSGYHDGDIHWFGNKIAFTRNSQIWLMNDDGTGAHQVTDPPRAGEWGDAVLPFGDYDPRIRPGGTMLVFSRLVDDKTSHGNYDMFRINVDGSKEVALTKNGYTQGLCKWSHKGDKILVLVSAIGEEGHYHIYMMNPDGTDYQDITPDFPHGFLCHSPIFSLDDSTVYFVGQWWGEVSPEEAPSEEASSGIFLVILGLLAVSIGKRKKRPAE